jgi:hypothetical protein
MKSVDQTLAQRAYVGTLDSRATDRIALRVHNRTSGAALVCLRASGH